MLSVEIQLHRPFDREPSNHSYGERVDSAADRLVGGDGKWSPARDQAGNPRALVAGTKIVIELHEDGPTILMSLVEHIDQIPNYLSAVASLISAWIAVRESRRQKVPKGKEYLGKSYTKIRVGDLTIQSERNLKTKEIERLVTAIATTVPDRRKKRSTARKR